MKFNVTMKCPDALDYAIMEALGTTKTEEAYDLRQVAYKFLKHGELMTVEFDTEAQTARVLEAR